MIFFDEFLEHSTINGKIYGTAFHSIFRIHGDGGPTRREILDVDMFGVKRIKEVANSVLVSSTGYKLRPKYIFIAPPDLPTLRHRLDVRNTESEADRDKLMEYAEQEIHYGMSKAFHARVYHIDLDQAVRDFTDAVSNLYEKFGRKLVSEEVDRLRQPKEVSALLRRQQRNALIQSLDKDAIRPVAPQDSRIIRQARRKAWLEEQKQLKEDEKNNRKNSFP
jgi:guanylate kinase